MISVILVNYKTREYLLRAIPALLTRVSKIKEIIVVDNNSGDDLSFLHRLDEKIRVVYNTENAGFGAGINRGAQESSGDWLYILNPDTEILSDPSEYLPQLKFDVQVLGCALIQPNRTDIQAYQYGIFPTMTDIIFQRAKNQWQNRYKDHFVETDWVSGGAMLIRRGMFESLGGFNEKYFMYYEDIDLCRRVKKRGGDILWTDQIKVLHAEGGSEPLSWKVKQRYFAGQRVYVSQWVSPVFSWLLWPIHEALVVYFYLKERFS